MARLIESMHTLVPAWYCARTKPKHEHIAAASLTSQLGLEVFFPRLRVERATRRGVVRVVDPLFPCYVFVRCIQGEMLDEIRYVNGVSSLVHFGLRIPVVPDQVIDELKLCFDSSDSLCVEDQLSAGTEVTIEQGSLMGTHAVVVRVLPAKRRVQVLLDFLGTATIAEVDRDAIAVENRSLADMLPALAAGPPRSLAREVQTAPGVR